MKRLIIGSLSLVFLSSLSVPVAQAQTQAINSETYRTTGSSVYQITPFELVSMANQGYFQEQGIPGYLQLVSAHQMGRLSAEQLVAAAIRANKLSPQIASDKGYLSAVEAQLQRLNIR
ncbi:hypothetical protein NIES2119_14080 [[Phormidium ambiguum] IAM M-71]|uniref:Uncharacterized protein n=1 Tax=[Phormidium ambiguum] IAM M-71 TaxID=454136 RepID=A0A1U7IJR5_9CYAN|nr:hypothetical protein [Phormidium ambiguum]OKH37370.1 hypothetical protein NIES2119_14080 [Phormidium ambiguum IAM M-71]